MRKDGILLLFLSEYKPDARSVRYTSESPDGTQLQFEGAQTNDAPVKYLIARAAENGCLIRKILCIVTRQVKEKQGFERFQQMVSGYIYSDQRLKEVYRKEEIEFCEITCSDLGRETSVRAAEVYQQIASQTSFCRGTETEVYIDYTGGLRDISFLMTVIIRYLEYHDIFCKEIVYSNWYDRKIHSIHCIYDMFQLLNGVSQFVSTGNAELLQACYEKEGDRDTRELLEQIVRFSHVMSLCDVEKVDRMMEELSRSLDQYDERKEKGSFFAEMFGDLTSVIRKKLNIERNQKYTYPDLIRWCLDNNMVQQALTLYVEKMPQYYYEEGFLNLPEKEQKMRPGASEESQVFYGTLYDRIGEPAELTQFSDRLKEGCERITDRYGAAEKLEPSAFRELGFCMKTEREKSAVRRLLGFLKKNYSGTPGTIWVPYTEEVWKSRSRTAGGFVKFVLRDRRWQHFFLYQDRDAWRKMEVGTYEKKVNALDRIQTYEGTVPESNVSNGELYHMMKYYLSLKMIRNRINHASTAEMDADEQNAIRRLEEDHGIRVEKEFRQVKSLMYQGLRKPEGIRGSVGSKQDKGEEYHVDNRSG